MLLRRNRRKGTRGRVCRSRAGRRVQCALSCPVLTWRTGTGAKPERAERVREEWAGGGEGLCGGRGGRIAFIALQTCYRMPQTDLAHRAKDLIGRSDADVGRATPRRRRTQKSW
eukprot:1346737-Rhodomonas_salina.4